jgi:hypothetical protein
MIAATDAADDDLIGFSQKPSIFGQKAVGLIP